MAIKPLRPCKHPGCGALTRDGWCPAHRPKHAARKESEAWHRMYSDPIWTQRLRPEQLLKEPFCRECSRHGLRVRASEVDHVIPHHGDRKLFSNPDNLQSLCHRCHSAKTMRELNEKSKKFRHD